MLAVISPAKSIDFEKAVSIKSFTMPDFQDKAAKLATKLKTMSPAQLSKLMDISADLGELNFKRYQEWHLPFTT